MSENSIYFFVFLVYAVVLLPDIIKLVQLIRKPVLGVDLDRYFKKIHLVALVFAVGLTVLLVSFEVNIFKYSSPIEYKDHEKITLKDFNGFKIPGQKLQGSSSFAFIKCNIDYEFRDDDVKVSSLFHPARSFVYIDDLEDEHLLRHEMYHFHITEYWSRILREKLFELESRPDQSQMVALWEGITEREREMQKEYDYDCDHGFLLGRQINWQNKIDSLLSEKEKYESSIVSFN